MSRICLLILPGLALTACRPDYYEDEITVYPVASTSTARLELGAVSWGESVSKKFQLTNGGDVPLGIDDIWLGTEELEDNFSLSAKWANVDCPERPDDQAEGDGGAEAADLDLNDTGDWYGDGGGTDSGTGGDLDVLDPGCRLPIEVTLTPEMIGPIYGSVHIRTVTEDIDENDEAAVEAGPAYYEEPDNKELVVLLAGEGDKGAPNIYASPRTLNFGGVWEGDSKSLLVNVSNTGSGDLILNEPYLDETCEEGFSLDWNYGPDHVLPADGLTGIEVSFTPLSDDGVACTLWVESNDPDEPFIDISMEGNVGTDPNECAPAINLIWPPVGYEHLSGDDLSVIFEVYDCNEPAQNLDLQIRSGVLFPEDPVLVDTFQAADESGYVEAVIPRDSLGRGTDTIIVRARDNAGNQSEVSTTVLYRATYPASDDDGDGYGHTLDDGTIDCDDLNIHSYPGAQEIYDESDNDCDGTRDEGTEGFDDDGDDYTEAEGDCDDADPDSNPDAEELPDFQDNNCDGQVDEGTANSDDDGDGFSEAEGDCNDRDEVINPLAIEYCDGTDNDCNGISDERDGCIGLDTTPIIFGGIQSERLALKLGESVSMTVLAYDADGDPVSYVWQQDAKLTSRGYVGIDNPGGVTVTFTAPSSFPDEDTESETYNIKVTVTDPDLAYDFANIDLVVSKNGPALEQVEQVLVRDGCGKGNLREEDAAAFLFLPGSIGLMALARRRRRSA